MLPLMGVGFLIQTIQGVVANQQANQMRAQYDAQLANMMRQNNATPTQNVQKKEPPKSHNLFQFDGPEFPEESFKNLQETQLGQAQKRNTAANNLQKDLQNMKSEFFAEHHYETEKGPDGKAKVLTDANGQPTVAKGPESGDSKLARMDFESSKKSAQHEEHCDRREKFVSGEKQKFTEFLTQNRDQLNNPTIHGELQRMVVDSKKKALQLQQNQEDERWRVDMPPSEKIAHRLNQGINDLHTMDQEHMKSEEESPDAKELMNHDQKVAAILGQRRDEAREEKRKEENFLMDPRKMMANRTNSENGTRDVGDCLPGYLTSSMYELGIYAV
jgi:hypothetical protein